VINRDDRHCRRREYPAEATVSILRSRWNLRFVALFLATIVPLCCTVTGCSDSRPAQPDIVLIVLDTVRADHTSLYGYERSTTPALTEIAAAATLYTRARATSPWTLPSHASMFTGIYPYEHGAHTVWVDLPGDESANDARGAEKKKAKRPPDLIDNVRPLPSGRPTLAEVLAAAGYRTAAIGANTIYLDEKYGLARGFETYDMEYSYYEGVNRRAAAWLDQDDGRPFFLFLNYMDAHEPYNSKPLTGLFEREVPPSTPRFIKKVAAEVLTTTLPVPERDLDLLTDQYDLGIANADAGVGRLIAMLRDRGFYDDLLLIVTSDHGEYLGEHRLITHSKDVFEPVMNLPLLVKTSRQRHGQVDDTPISLVHLPALILGYVTGADASPFPYADRGGDLLAENHFTRWKDLLEPWGTRFHRERHVLYRGDLKLILSSDGQDELYDLADDPQEQRNLIAEKPDSAAALTATLRRRLERAPNDLPAVELRELTAEEKRRMKALGYL
jgi:arylsulfatase A-like enzyme